VSTKRPTALEKAARQFVRAAKGERVYQIIAGNATSGPLTNLTVQLHIWEHLRALAETPE
jgi:hypothetical protein